MCYWVVGGINMRRRDFKEVRFVIILLDELNNSRGVFKEKTFVAMLLGVCVEEGSAW